VSGKYLTRGEIFAILFLLIVISLLELIIKTIMTNASVKNLLFGITVVTVTAIVSLGAFATTVHAQEDWGFDYSGGDTSSSYDWGYDYGNSSNYSDYPTTGCDTGCGSNYSDYPTSNSSDYPTSNYSDYPTSNYSDYPTSNSSDYPTSNYSDYPTYSADCGCYESSASTAYQTSQGYSYSTGGQSSYHSTPMTIAPPTYYSTPVTYRPSTPSYPVQPVQPVYTTTSNSNYTSNNCLYNSCNNSYVDNSINGSFNTNTAPVYVATPQPIVQYVYPQNYNYQTYSQAPFCSITIGQGYQSGMTNLTWSSSGATSAYISPNVGSVNVSGTTNIYSYGNAVYSLTVSGPGGTYTCRTQSYIAPAAPTTPYVSLSQIPYTGFDFGTFGNAIYWMGLLAFAVAGAYLVVYYQGGALALAGNMLGGRTVSYSETVTETAPTHTEVEVAHEDNREAPVALFNLPTMSAASTKDSMTVAHTADGVPRIVITRS
jgi:hypothetical protein